MRYKIFFPIGAKLIVLFSLLLGIVALSTIFMATKIFVENNTTLVQQMSIETANQLALRQRKILEGYQSKLFVISKYLYKDMIGPQNNKWDWGQEKALSGIFIFEAAEGEEPSIKHRLLSPRFDVIEDPQGEKILSIVLNANDFSLKRIMAGEVLVSRIAFGDETTFLALGAPFMKMENTGARIFYVGLFDEKEFHEAFQSGDAISSILVSASGELLAPMDSPGYTADHLKAHPLVQKIREATVENYQTTFSDPSTNERKISAYQNVGFSGLSVISEVSETRALEIVHRVRYRAGLVAGLVLSVAFLVTYFFSKTLTSPIERLARAAQLIREGNFHIRIKAKGHDEVSHLSNTFNEMAEGLEERDRVKEVFSRFHNKQIADKILAGELKLGGERREAVIFFSDLRDFTTLSESKEPERVVEMINEYFSRMVGVIHRRRGVVDKYVGDAIVALWGVPLESPTALSDAIGACLEMREELKALNEIRLSRGEEALRMGMGLHVGTVIVGNIGSDQRMEYTAIGDSMNLASRIQSKTKEFKEDFLVSEEVAKRLSHAFIFQSLGDTFVKGKSQSVSLFKVVGPVEQKQAA